MTMRRLSADLAHALAAEYVLGTLRGRARRRFEAIARADAGVATILRRWETDLVPLAERVAPVEPPARVWREIEARIGTTSAARAGFWSSVGFWRAVGLMSGGLAAVLLAVFLGLSPGPRSEPLFVAVLTSADAAPRMVVSMHEPDIVRVRVVKHWPAAKDRSLELWALPRDGAPRSLGVMTNALGDTIFHIAAADPRMQGAQTLAISLEPAGGSPTGQRTGAIVCSGPIAAVRKT